MPVLNVPLNRYQQQVLQDLGIDLVSTNPTNEPYLLIGSRCWFTQRLLLKFLNQNQMGQIKITHEGFQKYTEPLQDLISSGVHELALMPANAKPSFEGLNLVEIPLELEKMPPLELPTALKGSGEDEIFLGEEMIMQVDHWSHLIKVNVLALAVKGYSEKRAFKAQNILLKIWRVLKVLFKARSLNGYRIAAALSQIGSKCDIHPTAIIEASIIGSGVKVGPYSVIRGSFLADGAKVDEHASINLSVLGENSQVGKQGIVTMCVLMEGAMVSSGGGPQASVFGRNSFMAWTATILDYAFSKNVKVLAHGKRVDSGSKFLGAAIGHNAILGAGVTIGYGTEIPNEASLVKNPDNVMKLWPENEVLIKQ